MSMLKRIADAVLILELGIALLAFLCMVFLTFKEWRLYRRIK